MSVATTREEEALRLKGVAETKFNNNNLKSALKYAKRAQRLAPHLHTISQTVTSLTILRAAAESPTTTTPNWYKILDLEPFSNINLIRKQYKNLAFILHPDKNSFLGSEEAFKLVGEASHFLSDKVRKQEYDMKLRVWIQEEKVSEEEMENTFWTACSTCRLLHKFERRYVGHNLVCPSCNKSFKAVEEVNDYGSKQNEQVGSKGGSFKFKENVEVDGGETLGEFVLRRKFKSKGVKGKMGSEKDGVLKDKVGVDEVRNGDLEKEGFSEWGGGRLRTGSLRKRMSTVGEVLERSDPKRIKTGEETMTLAEFQSGVKKKLQQKKVKLMVKEKEEDGNDKRSKQGEKLEGSKNNRGSAIGKARSLKKSVKLAIKEKYKASMEKKELRLEKHRGSSGGNLENMAVVDSDFYDFDKDRTERSFKKDQVWAVYDDDDGMPRTCALIDEFISANPFEVRISWLDLQNNGKDML